jgi:hypothetical protein
MTAPNAELAYKVLDYIEAHPERHDQNAWVGEGGPVDATAESVESCGTTACFGGWTVLLSGLAIDIAAGVVLDGERLDVSTAAGKLLGLSEGQKENLFFGADDLDDVRFEVAEIFGPRPAVTE